MVRKLSKVTIEKLCIAEAQAGENATKDDIGKCYVDPQLAAAIGKYCSMDLFFYLHESANESGAITFQAPELADFNLSPIDFVRLSNQLRAYKRFGFFIGAVSTEAAVLILNTDDPAWARLLLGFVPAMVVGTLAQSLFGNIFLKTSSLIKSCVRYSSAMKTFQRSKLSYWQNLTWREFESQTAELLNNLGLEATATKGSGDKGIDIEARINAKRLLVQCKKHKKPVGPAVVRELIGTVTSERAYGGAIVSISGFSNAAHEASEGRILLLETSDLLGMDRKEFQRVLRGLVSSI